MILGQGFEEKEVEDGGGTRKKSSGDYYSANQLLVLIKYFIDICLIN